MHILHIHTTVSDNDNDNILGIHYISSTFICFWFFISFRVLVSFHLQLIFLNNSIENQSAKPWRKQREWQESQWRWWWWWQRRCWNHHEQQQQWFISSMVILSPFATPIAAEDAQSNIVKMYSRQNKWFFLSNIVCLRIWFYHVLNVMGLRLH